MIRQNNIRAALPYICAVGLFLLICVGYFFPQYQGRAIRMNDIVQYEGARKDIKDHIALTGEDPQWTGNMFGGMPSSLIDMRYGSQVIKKATPILEFMGRPASLIFLAMLSFYLMLLFFGVDPWLGIIPSLAYGLSTYFFLIIGAGHITKMLALGYAPFMVGAIYYTLRKNMWVGASLTALAASLQISANHPQITYYFGFVVLVLWINEGVRAIREKYITKFAKATGLLLIAGILAFGSNLAPLWYINEYSGDSIRGGSELTYADPAGSRPASANRSNGLDIEYATQWSYGKSETFNTFIPYLTGGSSEGNFSADGAVANSLTRYGARDVAGQLPSYWGPQPFTAGPTYLGAVAILLFVAGLFVVRPSGKVWVLAVTILAVLLSWGNHFMWFTELFFNYFPGYNKFRAVSTILVIAEWTVPFLGALMLHKLVKCDIEPKKINRAIIYSFSITGGLALLFFLLGPGLFSFVSPTDSMLQVPQDVEAAMVSERASMLRSDSLRSFIYVALATLVLLLFVKGKLRKQWMVAALAVLVIFDMIGVNRRFLSSDRFEEKKYTEITATVADKEIMQDKEPGFRVINFSVNPFNDATTSYFHRSVGGYHGAKMRRYQDIISGYLTDPYSDVYNMLNTKYFILTDPSSGAVVAQENYSANGPAWFVDEVTLVDGPDQEFTALAAIDNKREAVVDKRFSELVKNRTPGTDSLDRIELTQYAPNYLKYEYMASSPREAVFSEIYYDKGWQAYLDGQPVPHYRVNYILRGMSLPEGEHTVEFRYRALNFGTVSALTLFFSLLVIGSVVVSVTVLYLCNRKKRKFDAERQEN